MLTALSDIAAVIGFYKMSMFNPAHFFSIYNLGNQLEAELCTFYCFGDLHTIFCGDLHIICCGDLQVDMFDAYCYK